MPTTSQLFGLTPQEQAAATFTSLGEAGPGRDIFGPYVTLLNRRLHGGYGKDIVQMATAPQQFVANARYNPSQVSDPAFGRKVYGSRYDQAYNQLNDPGQVSSVYNQLRGATQFRGQELLGKRKKDDVMLDPKGNFYFDYNPNVYQKGSSILKAAGTNVPGPTTTASTNQQTRGGDTYNFYLDDPKSFLGMFRSTHFGDTSGITDMFKSPGTAFDKDRLMKQLTAIIGGDKTDYGGDKTYYGGGETYYG